MRRRKRKPISPLGKAWQKFSEFLVVVVFVLAVPIVLPIYFILELINRCRRYCPLHHEQFHYEHIYLRLEEITANRLRQFERQEAFRKAREEGRPYLFRRPGERYNSRIKRRLFPYSCTEPLTYTKVGRYRRRYCSSCRNAEAEWKIQTQQ